MIEFVRKNKNITYEINPGEAIEISELSKCGVLALCPHLEYSTELPSKQITETLNTNNLAKQKSRRKK